jgi:hypothetical protein
MNKMKAKNIVVLSAMLALALVLTATVSAGEITTNYAVEVEGLDAYANYVSVIAGDTITIKVYFKSDVYDTDVTVEAELEGDKVDTHAITPSFDVEQGAAYRKTLTLEVPYELKDQLSDNVTLHITIDGRNDKTELNDITLKVQRPSYDASIKSITLPNSISAGQTVPVDFVLKNIGYNNLDDVYVDVSIPELGISQGPMWVGDLVNIKNCSDDCDNEDTVSGRIYLTIPYGVEAGIYSLKLVVSNDDTESTQTKQIYIQNELSNEVITLTTQANAKIGEEVQFTILLVNPTDNVKVYSIVTEPLTGVSVSLDQSVVAVSAGSSKTITITAKATAEGAQTFSVNVLSNNKVIDTVKYSLNVANEKTSATTSSTLILTIVLAVVFLVLLVVLIVLLARKPAKSEEIGSESYY